MESETITLVVFWLCSGSSSYCFVSIKISFFVYIDANTVPKWLITTKFFSTFVKFIDTFAQIGIFWTPFMLVWPSLIPLAHENSGHASTENPLMEIINRFAPIFNLPGGFYNREPRNCS